jgi:MFS family permease
MIAHHQTYQQHHPVTVFLGLSSFEMLAMFRRGLFYAYLSIYLRHFLGMSVTETTLFATLPMVANVLCQTFVWGTISDRFQVRRTLIILGEVLAGFGTVLVWYAHTLPVQRIHSGWVVIAGLTLVELFWSMSNVGWSALIADIYRARDRTAIQGRLASIGGLGRMAGVGIGGLLYDGMGHYYSGWGFQQGALFFVAAGVMFFSIAPMLLVPEGGIPTNGRATVDPEESTASGSERLFVIFLIAMTLINFGRNSIAIIIPQYLTLETGFAVSSQMLSYIVNTQSAAMIFTGLISGWFGRSMGDGPALVIGSGVALGAVLLFALSDSLVVIFGLNVLRGFSEVIILATSYAFSSVLIPPTSRARYFAWFNATFFLSWGVAGTLITGPVTDVMISRGTAEVLAYRMAFLAASALTLLGVIILGILLWNMRRKSPTLPLREREGLFGEKSNHPTL